MVFTRLVEDQAAGRSALLRALARQKGGDPQLVAAVEEQVGVIQVEAAQKRHEGAQQRVGHEVAEDLDAGEVLEGLGEVGENQALAGVQLPEGADGVVCHLSATR